jgi:hypothetical protein
MRSPLHRRPASDGFSPCASTIILLMWSPSPNPPPADVIGEGEAAAVDRVGGGACLSEDTASEAIELSVGQEPLVGPACPHAPLFATILAHSSRSWTARLNTSLPPAVSGSTQK